MSVTKYGVNDALTVKQWARGLSYEALKATPIGPLMGKSTDAIIQVKDETAKSAGDKITCGLRMQLTGDGVTENETQEGNEEALTTYSDSLVINELLHAVRVRNKNTIDSQRVLFNMRKEAKMGLTDWFAKRFSVSFFNQVCGRNQTGLSPKYTGLQAPVAPSATRRIVVDATGPTVNSEDENIVAADTFSLEYVDYAKELADTADPQIRPISVGGEKVYVMYLHPYQITDLRTNTDTGQWLDIQKAAMAGMQATKNPIFSGALGVYNNVILRKSHDVPTGVNSSTLAAVSTVRRAVLLGAQSAVVAFGRRTDKSPHYKWVEKTFDYDRELGVSAQTVYGLKKCVYNSLDFGTVVVSSYAAAHTN